MFALQHPAFLYMLHVIDPSIVLGGYNKYIDNFGTPIAESFEESITRAAHKPGSRFAFTGDFYKAPHTQRSVLQLTLRGATPDGAEFWQLPPLRAPTFKSAENASLVIIAYLITKCKLTMEQILSLTTDSGASLDLVVPFHFITSCGRFVSSWQHAHSRCILPVCNTICVCTAWHCQCYDALFDDLVGSVEVHPPRASYGDHVHP